MRKAMTLSIILIVFAWTVFGQNGSIQVGGKARNFIVYVPSGVLENPPLVINLHGLNVTPTMFRSFSQFDRVADKEKFINVYPEGIDKKWEITGNSDVDFILVLIDTLAVRYKIDRNRVYVTGHSMGGMMSYNLACVATDKIAAIGAASGYPLNNMGGGNCSPKIPIPIMHTHGTADDMVSISGLEAYIAKFVKSNGCPETPAVTNPSSKITKKYWGPCKEGSEIIIYLFDGMGHVFPSTSSEGFDAPEEFWKFFKQHTRGAVKISRPVSGARSRTAHVVSAGYCAGKIHLKGDRDIRAVGVFDVQGKSVLSWKATTGPVWSLEFPVNHPAGGIYLVNVAGATENAVVKVLIP